MAFLVRFEPNKVVKIFPPHLTCPSCGERDVGKIDVTEDQGEQNGLPIVRCLSCGRLFVSGETANDGTVIQRPALIRP